MIDFINSNITVEMSENEIENFILQNAEGQSELDSLVESIKSGGNKEEIFFKLEDVCKNEKLVSIIKKLISRNLMPYEEMTFLRNKSDSEFNYIIRYTLDNTILTVERKNVVLEAIGVSETELTCIVRLLNTLNSMVIAKRYSKGFFSEKVYDMFRFDDEKVEFLWELYDSHRQELNSVVLLNNITLIKNINTNLKQLFDLFNDIFGEDSDDSDE